SATRHHTYGYENGLLSSVSDARGFTTSISYDGLGHPTRRVSSGSKVPQQNQNTTYSYDPRGLLTSVSQSYADPSTGPSTAVIRGYDAYGQLITESTSLNGTPHSAWKQSWDGAGRRVALNWSLDNQSPAAQYGFSYNALDLMTSAQNSSGSCSYGYGSDGLLLSRTTPFGTTTIARDNDGRIVTEKLPTGAQESLSWRGDNRLASYSMADTTGALVSETRNYSYDGRGRVMQEPFTSTEHGTQLASYEFDPLNTRMKQEVDDVIATAVVNQNIFSQVTRDNFPTTEDHLKDSCYDGAGEVTAQGAKSLTWDSFGRLVKVMSRDSNNRGYDWVTVYDGLGRRLQSAYQDATENQTTSAPLTLQYYYDPEVEFLEIGHDFFGRTWNLFGPDRSGIYGGAQGIGGMETTYAENGQATYGILKNFFGDHLGNLNTLGLYAWGEVLGGYGAMPGFSVNTDLVPQWRGHYLDWTGFYYMGARYYDPESGRFLSADPLGHNASLSLYDYCDGDPVNGLDPDGRCDNNMNRTQQLIETASDPKIKADLIKGRELSIKNGDIYYHYTTPQERMDKYGYMPLAYSANGIWTDVGGVLNMQSAIAHRLELNENDVFAIQNPSMGKKEDLIRAVREESGAIDIRSIRAADMIRASGGGTIIAYSNGAEVIYGAFRLLSAEVKANINYEGFGPQININQHNVPGLHSYYNETGSHDWVGVLLNRGKDVYWNKIIPQEGYNLFENHNFIKNYAPDVHSVP
ncbi:MAG: RHS repeat-associated core domain-containing protein, partial [Chthoniobacterales bacterium]|nr:RHS repeat-associated core domain-containing protein [Chthoniobacterales bacterium]